MKEPRVRLRSVADTRGKLRALGWFLCSPIEIKNHARKKSGYQIWRATASAWKNRVPGGYPVRASAEVRAAPGGSTTLAWKRKAALVLLRALGG